MGLTQDVAWGASSSWLKQYPPCHAQSHSLAESLKTGRKDSPRPFLTPGVSTTALRPFESERVVRGPQAGGISATGQLV